MKAVPVSVAVATAVWCTACVSAPAADPDAGRSAGVSPPAGSPGDSGLWGGLVSKDPAIDLEGRTLPLGEALAYAYYLRSPAQIEFGLQTLGGTDGMQRADWNDAVRAMLLIARSLAGPPDERRPDAFMEGCKITSRIIRSPGDEHGAVGALLNGITALLSHDVRHAREALSLALQYAPTYCPLQAWVALAEFECGDSARALGRIRQCAKKGPKNWFVLTTGALLLFRSAKYEDALAASREALELDRHSPDAWFRHGALALLTYNQRPSETLLKEAGAALEGMRLAASRATYSAGRADYAQMAEMLERGRQAAATGARIPPETLLSFFGTGQALNGDPERR